MKHPRDEKRLLFQASAVALAGQIRRENEFAIPSVAGSSLPVTGGKAKGEASGQSFGNGLLSYEHAATMVDGDYQDREAAKAFTYGNHGENTLLAVNVTESQISGLRIVMQEKSLSIGSMAAHMESHADHNGPPRFVSLKAEFCDVKVNNVGLTINTHCDVFEHHDTRDKLVAAFENDRKFQNDHNEHFFSAAPGSLSDGPGATLSKSHAIYGTIVSSMDWEGGVCPPGVTKEGNRVQIDGLGTLYFGEILVKDDFRHITLLRFQLGSPDGGEGSAGDMGNGVSRYPPT